MSQQEFNPNLTFLWESVPKNRVSCLQGGARSGKTTAALQYFIDYADTYSGNVISIVRNTFPSLRATALRDFIDLMEETGLYDPNNESKPSGYYEYEHEGNLFEFFSVDNEAKVRGRKRDILYYNEANEGNLETFRQLALRTSGRIILDFNPSDADGYVREHIQSRPDTETCITTYLDNPFLSLEQIAEIELLKLADPEYYAVFGLGQYGRLAGQILGHYKVCYQYQMPIGHKKIYGLDFGYSAPSALAEAIPYDNAIYARQLLYERRLTNTQLIAAVKLLLPLDAIIYADSAEPDRIQEFKDAGFINIQPANKSWKPGIDMLRSKPLYVCEDSKDAIREVKGYRYKTGAGGITLEEPVPSPDHWIDALRYAVFSHFRQAPKPKHKASFIPTPKGLID